MSTEHFPRRAPTPEPRSAPVALAILLLAAFAVVLAALPYPVFELDRYTFPKELVLEVAAFAAALVTLASARRLTLFAVDGMVGLFLLISALSGLVANNGWLALRALGVTLAGAALFWSARAVARAGLGTPLVTGLAIAVVLGAVTGLVQAYGLVSTSLASLTRAPGGTFGNRNFMAHLVAIGLPLLLFVTLDARSRTRLGFGAAGVCLAATALVLSRSRAAWLAASVAGAFLTFEGLWVGRLWGDRRLRSRVVRLAAVAGLGVVLALALPNRLNWRSDSPYLESLAGVANYKEGSGRGRVIQYGNTLKMAVRHPLLGVGPGNWPVFYPAFMSREDPSFDPDDIIPTNPWPSSDWMAMASERGFPALAVLLLTGGFLALGAWSRVRRGARHGPALADLAIVATLLTIAVAGAFDAVLLLPAPTLFAWTIVGALASGARPVREIGLTAGVRRALMAGVLLLGTPIIVRGAAQTLAMAAFDDGSRPAMERAALIDPGSYRIHMLVGRAWVRAGRCDRAIPHASAARALFPNYPAPIQLLRACGVRARR
ncbi:MAG: O-antigen ligase family protein [Gemmatimonadales bacterium]